MAYYVVYPSRYPASGDYASEPRITEHEPRVAHAGPFQTLAEAEEVYQPLSKAVDEDWDARRAAMLNR